MDSSFVIVGSLTPVIARSRFVIFGSVNVMSNSLIARGNVGSLLSIDVFRTKAIPVSCCNTTGVTRGVLGELFTAR